MADTTSEAAYLDNPAAQRQAAAELRRAKRSNARLRRKAAVTYLAGRRLERLGNEAGEAGGFAPEVGVNMAEEGRDIAGALRRDRQAAKAAREEEKKGKSEDEGGSIIASQGTSRALRWAWYHLITTWGLSLLYINIHAFLHLVLGDRFFCKLGREWVPKQLAKGTQGKMLNFLLGIAEIIVFIGVNMLALLLVALLGFMVYLIVDIATHNLIENIWNYGLKPFYYIIRALLGIK